MPIAVYYSWTFSVVALLGCLLQWHSPSKGDAVSFLSGVAFLFAIPVMNFAPQVSNPGLHLILSLHIWMCAGFLFGIHPRVLMTNRAVRP